MGEDLPQTVVNHHPDAHVDDTPNPWDHRTSGYHVNTILKLIIFYNDDFGIVADDGIAEKREKLNAWLLD